MEELERETATSHTLFPVVGIGASAGGLEAITELFSNLPAHSGMAFLLVQHMHPDHASMLAEILTRKISMPVTEAVEGQLVEQNHVYVIPPNTSMSIIEGRLRLKARNDTLGPPMPIDDLFYSLAEDAGSAAIGVILSGGGSDGATGMQMIKGAGGITFAQDEATAKVSNMPRAAISMGCVDFVLPPENIAGELARISQHPFIAAQSRQLDINNICSDEKNLRKIFHILNSVCNVDYTHYKRGTVTRRLMRRIALLNLNSLPSYIDFLEKNPGEIQALRQDLLIGVTQFFRDPEAFEAIVKIVFPQLIEKRSSTEPVRIWVPGCSSGEEVYSLAICMLEYLGKRANQVKIQFFGTDINEEALVTARAGIYIENIEREVSEERLQRFFTRKGEYYQIDKSIRDLCIFAPHNVTCDPPFSQLDLISCRNLLIYFDAVLQKQVIPLFHYALKPDKFLILGPSETIGASSDLFSVTNSKKLKIYTRNPGRSKAHLDYLKETTMRKSENKVHKMLPSIDMEKQKRDIDRIAMKHYVPAGVLCDANLNVLEFRGDTGPYLVQPSGPPSTNLRHLLRPGLLVEISSMIETARKEFSPVRRTSLRVEMADGMQEVSLEIIPVKPENDAGPVLFLIFFEKGYLEASRERNKFTGLRNILGPFIGERLPQKTQQQDKNEIIYLKQELDATREHIKSIFEDHEVAQEELKASQEELLSSNEEFQSTNEELETAKEELQSSNEELITTNDELRHRNNELHILNNKLEHARNYADAIVETVREPLIVLDNNLRVIRANVAFYAYFKLTPAETQGQLFCELNNRQWHNSVLRTLLEKVISEKIFVQDYEITNHFPGIGEKTMLLNARHMLLEKESLILLAIEDVTERKLSHDKLKDADRRKDEFLAMLAHELRGPLAPIRNALEIWRRGNAKPEAIKEAQTMMDRQLRKEARLIDDLLDVARITGGVITLNKEPVNLAKIVEQAVESTRHLFEMREHELKVQLPQEEIIIEGDLIRLEQIVSNLLTNAAKYTEYEGKIILKLEEREGKAVLSIQDNGIGIAPDLMPRIFDLFMQADVSIDRAQGGLGIGLTVVKRLVEMQGGTIKVSSEGLNKGSLFVINFPVCVGPNCSVPVKKSSVSIDVTPRRILVVDDNADSAKTTGWLLELEGHEVKTAFNGPSAIKRAQKFSPEIILLDIGLPGMNGYEVVKKLRELPEGKSMLLIAHSGYGQQEDRRRSLEAGFDHHLVKPASTEELKELIAGYNNGKPTP